MGEPMKKTSCQIACWAMGAAAGFVAFVMLMALGGWGFIQAVFGAGVIFVLLGGLMAWIFCKPLPPLAQAQSQTAAPAPAPKVEAASAAAPTEAPAAAPAAPAAAAITPAAAVVKSGTLLAGEQDLAARKGSWTYQPAAAPAPAPKAKAKAAPKPKAEPKAKAEAKARPAAKSKAAPKAKGPAKPATLTAARGGTPDNLKEIKGVGPKLEAMLHGMGFYHFDQIAGWSAAELAWVDENLEGFKGRASRDNWVAQARILASGGETEFSKRVEDGDVY